MLRVELTIMRLQLGFDPQYPKFNPPKPWL